MTNRALFITVSASIMIAGVGMGWLGSQLFSEPVVLTANVPTEEIQPQMTEEELSQLCAKNVEEHKENVLDLQKKVRGLQGTLKEKETELEELRKEQKKKPSSQTSKRQEELESELATLRIQLAATEQERDSLRTELKQTLKKLDKQIRETKKYKAKAKKYKRQSVENLWKAFVADAKVQACDRGSRKRHEKCWAEFNQTLSNESNHRQRFMTCVNTYQAVPVLRKAKLFERLPSFATWLSGEKNRGKFIKGWYILFCDPSLPTNTEDPERNDRPEKPKKNQWSDLDFDD